MPLKMTQADVMLKKEMELYSEDDWDTPELEESTYNPANDEFKRTVLALQRRANHLSTTMRPRHVLVARYSLQNYTNVEIAKKLRYSPQQIGNILRQQDVQDLRRVMTNLNALLSGVSALEREQMLWRIALKNEEFNPRTSVAAVAEINKMKIDTQAAKEKSKHNQQIANTPNVVIQLSDPRLTPTQLDAPKEMKDVN
jgi:hypothetical protein